MIDVKKLVTSFLALAAVAGLAAFLLSNPRFYNGTLGSNLLAPGRTPVPSNAFVLATEKTPLALRENLAGGSPNLTNAAAENVAQVILALNPNGPQQLADGTTGFIVPTTTLLTAYLTMESPSFDISDLWTSPNNETYTPAATADAAANRQYTDNFRSIIKNTLSSPDFIASAKKAATSGGNDSAFLATAASTFGDASQQLKTIPVPAPFATFHKSFLAYLDDQQTAVSILANNNSDPLKSMIVLNSADQVQQQIVGDFSNTITQYKALNLPGLLAASQPQKNSWMDNTVAFANNIASSFSIPIAYAQDTGGDGSLSGDSPEDNCGQDFLSSFDSLAGGLSDLFSAADDLGDLTDVPVTDSTLQKTSKKILDTDSSILKDEAASLGVLIYECQNQDLAQKTKENEINVMNQVETNNIKNNGNSQVIGDFGQYQQDAALRAGTQAYKKISATICPQFQAAVNSIVFNPASSTLDSGTSSSTNSDLNSDTMSNSSASGIGSLGGNTTGSTFGSSQVNGTGSQCPLTSQSSSLSSSGNSTTDQSSASAFLNNFANPNANLYGTVLSAHDTIDSQMGAAAAGAQAESVANQGLKAQTTCKDSYVDAKGNTICDQTQITTPGSVVSSQIQATINSQYTSILNSNNPAKMDTQLANSLGMQLQKNQSQGLTGFLPQTGDSLASICNSLAPAGTNSGQNPAFLACNSTMGKLINDYNKYSKLAKSVGSLLDTYSKLEASF